MDFPQLLRCEVCGETKPWTYENFERTQKGGALRRMCRACRYDYNRNYRVKIEEADDTARTYLKYKWSHLKAKRRKSNIYVDEDLKGEDAADFFMELWEKQNGRCALSGVPMTWGVVYGRIRSARTSDEHTQVSIDRIDNNLGYTRDNIQLVCYIVNYMRGYLSVDEFYIWCNSIIRQLSDC